LVPRNAKHALDAFSIADANLSVSFGEKARTAKDRRTLQKNTADRIDWCFIRFFPDIMQGPDNRAIKVASQLVWAIRWQSVSSLFRDFDKSLVGTDNMLDTGRCCEVEAES
jgi:hypothetical protein